MSELMDVTIRRILVALDASAHSLAALEEAASLAEAMEAELVGLFVEDTNLLRLASLPFARQLSYPSGAAEPLSGERLERELKVRAERARKALEAAAARRRRPWTFRAVRGQVVREILAAAMQADLILAGKSGWSPAQPLGSTALALIAAAPRSFLLVHQETAPAAPILSVYEDSAESRRALELAVRLAEARDTGLVVFLLAATPEAGMTLQQQASEIIGHRLKHARFRRIEREDPVELARLLRSEEDGLLVLSGASLLAEEAAIRKLLELVPNPVLLLRPES